MTFNINQRVPTAKNSGTRYKFLPTNFFTTNVSIIYTPVYQDIFDI